MLYLHAKRQKMVVLDARRRIGLALENLEVNWHASVFTCPELTVHLSHCLDCFSKVPF